MRPSRKNAALRYWSTFSEVQDSGVTDQQAKELNAILDGTAPYDDLKYKDLPEKNTCALEIMAGATSLPNCDWGLDYEVGHDVPVDYARKALILRRLNVLYAFHLLKTGNKDGGGSGFGSRPAVFARCRKWWITFCYANRKRPSDESLEVGFPV